MKTCRKRFIKQFKRIVWVPLNDSIFLRTLMLEYILFSNNYCKHSKTVIKIKFANVKVLNKHCSQSGTQVKHTLLGIRSFRPPTVSSTSFAVYFENESSSIVCFQKRASKFISLNYLSPTKKMQSVFITDAFSHQPNSTTHIDIFSVCFRRLF